MQRFGDPSEVAALVAFCAVAMRRISMAGSIPSTVGMMA
jgi:hypothetical protein